MNRSAVRQFIDLEAQVDDGEEEEDDDDDDDAMGTAAVFQEILTSMADVLFKMISL
jgi:hypothetical protein